MMVSCAHCGREVYRKPVEVKKYPISFCSVACKGLAQRGVATPKDRIARTNYARRERSPHWKGGRTRINGYPVRKVEGHPRADANGYVYEHVLVVEAALGKPLRATAAVHHLNEDRTDNQPRNLVACQDNAYHMVLHQRQRALTACGHAGWRKCRFCKQYDAPENLLLPRRAKQSAIHRHCHAEYERKRGYAKRDAQRALRRQGPAR